MSTTEELPHPRVGVAAIIRNPSNADQLLVGRRLGSHGKGHWQFPGGHLEYGEAFNGCAERETLEETGLNVEAKGLVAVTNGVFVLERKHYITLFVACKMIDVGAVPEVLEPEKCEGWHWKSWDTICSWVDHHDDMGPEWKDYKCFLPIINLVRENKNLIERL